MLLENNVMQVYMVLDGWKNVVGHYATTDLAVIGVYGHIKTKYGFDADHTNEDFTDTLQTYKILPVDVVTD
jgi:hypothetical protein